MTNTNFHRHNIDYITKAVDEGKFERKAAANGKLYFNLKATNGQVIGSSQMYENEASRDKGIASVMTNAPTATTEEEIA